MGKSIESVLSDHTERLMETSGVVGVGIGLCDGKPCIRVFVDGDAHKGLPSVIEGYRVDVLVTGEFRSLG